MPKFLIVPTRWDETVAKVHREDCPFAIVIARIWGMNPHAWVDKNEYAALKIDGVIGLAPCLTSRPKRNGAY